MAQSTESNKAELQRFNIALFPQDKQFISKTIKLAQDNFADCAEEYLLGDNAWPHITLCQFEAHPNSLSGIWAAVAPLAKSPLSIRLGPFYILLYEDYYWVGLETVREPELLSLHLAVNEALNNLGIRSKQPHSGYFPHITWTRCNSGKPLVIRVLPTADFWSARYLFGLSIGESSPYGVYRKRLLPD